MLCGGAEELHPTVTGSFDVLFATSSHYNDAPKTTPRPFDRDRDGLVCGEGAGILVLEDMEQAQAVFDLGFNLTSPPPRPTVYAREYDRAIDLLWGTEADGDIQINEDLGEEFHFQGFNLYQGESVAGPWKKVFTYDVDDSIGLI